MTNVYICLRKLIRKRGTPLLLFLCSADKYFHCELERQSDENNRQAWIPA